MKITEVIGTLEDYRSVHGEVDVHVQISCEADPVQHIAYDDEWRHGVVIYG